MSRRNDIMNFAYGLNDLGYIWRSYLGFLWLLSAVFQESGEKLVVLEDALALLLFWESFYTDRVS